MRPLNLQEAAQFLRMSKSNLYQRKDIPRFRRPGSRALLFDQEELEAWVRTGRVGVISQSNPAVGTMVGAQRSHEGHNSASEVSPGNALDIHASGVYHRNPRYR